jgi:hypothetical protein
MYGIDASVTHESRFQRSFRNEPTPGALPQAMNDSAPLALEGEIAQSHSLINEKFRFSANGAMLIASLRQPPQV